MIYLSDRGAPPGFVAVVNIDDLTRIILSVRILDVAESSPSQATQHDADDFDLSDPALQP